MNPYNSLNTLQRPQLPSYAHLIANNPYQMLTTGQTDPTNIQELPFNDRYHQGIIGSSTLPPPFWSQGYHNGYHQSTTPRSTTTTTTPPPTTTEPRTPPTFRTFQGKGYRPRSYKSLIRRPTRKYKTKENISRETRSTVKPQSFKLSTTTTKPPPRRGRNLSDYTHTTTIRPNYAYEDPPERAAPRYRKYPPKNRNKPKREFRYTTIVPKSYKPSQSFRINRRKKENTTEGKSLRSKASTVTNKKENTRNDNSEYKIDKINVNESQFTRIKESEANKPVQNIFIDSQISEPFNTFVNPPNNYNDHWNQPFNHHTMTTNLPLPNQFHLLQNNNNNFHQPSRNLGNNYQEALFYNLLNQLQRNDQQELEEVNVSGQDNDYTSNQEIDNSRAHPVQDNIRPNTVDNTVLVKNKDAVGYPGRRNPNIATPPPSFFPDRSKYVPSKKPINRFTTPASFNKYKLIKDELVGVKNDPPTILKELSPVKSRAKSPKFALDIKKFIQKPKDTEKYSDGDHYSEYHKETPLPTVKLEEDQFIIPGYSENSSENDFKLIPSYPTANYPQIEIRGLDPRFTPIPPIPPNMPQFFKPFHEEDLQAPPPSVFQGSPPDFYKYDPTLTTPLSIDIVNINSSVYPSESHNYQHENINEKYVLNENQFANEVFYKDSTPPDWLTFTKIETVPKRFSSPTHRPIENYSNKLRNTGYKSKLNPKAIPMFALDDYGQIQFMGNQSKPRPRRRPLWLRLAKQKPFTEPLDYH